MLVSLTYDWIAKTLYVSERIISTGQLRLYRTEIYNTENQETVFPNLLWTTNLNSVVESEINPVKGQVEFYIGSINHNFIILQVFLLFNNY